MSRVRASLGLVTMVLVKDIAETHWKESLKKRNSLELARTKWIIPPN